MIRYFGGDVRTTTIPVNRVVSDIGVSKVHIKVHLNSVTLVCLHQHKLIS